MHLSHAFTKLFSHIIFLGNLVCHMTYLYKYVANSLCNMHIHPMVVSLTCIHMLSMHATYHTSLPPVTIHLYVNVHYEVPVAIVSRSLERTLHKEHHTGPAAKVLEALVLPTVNAHLLPADDQHGFRPGHSTTSALLQLTTDIATGFNQKKPPHRTVCVAVDLTAAFDTVSHNVLISKISRSTLPEVTSRWLSCYLRGRQAVTSCRGVKSSTRIVHTGVPEGSKLSPSLFSFYLADMPRPTHPVKRICYADDISVWASGAKIPELEVKINDYLKEMSEFLTSNSLLISAPQSTVTLFTPETKQAKYHPDIKIAGSQLPLNPSPKILGVHLDTSLTFNVHCTQAATRVSNRNNVLKALAGTTWGQQKETILMTYKAIGRSVANYGAPVWSTNASATSIGKIQIAQNEALRIATGSHKMSSIDHLHNETEMLTVKQHSDLLSAQYLVQCLDPDHVCHTGLAKSRLLFVLSRPPAFTGFNRLLLAITGFYWL